MKRVHESDLRLLRGDDALTTYQFHTRTAQHYFCSTCGIYPFHRKRVDPAGIPVRATAGAKMD